nr:MAG TPA: helix-turn-helix domain protein [Caudoviricetes sp.]
MIDGTEKKGSKNMNESRDFKGVWIPKKVWLDTRLNALEKIILTEIDSLDNGEKGCYASNEHLAEFCQCSKTKVSTAIKKLIDCGYIYVQNFDGRKRELKSRLSNFERQNIKNCKADIQNLKESNTDNKTDNNTNNTVSKKERKSKSKSYDEQIAEYTQNEDLQNALKAFVQMRAFIKSPVTEHGLKLLLNKLTKISRNDAEKITIVNNSIENNWKGFYGLKEESKSVQPEKKYDQNGYESEEELMAMFYGK